MTGNWPQNHTLTAFAYTRRGILVSPSQFWCGTGCPGPFVAFPGFFANPVWTGTELLTLTDSGYLLACRR